MSESNTQDGVLHFAADADPRTVLQQTADLAPSERVEFWQTFSPTEAVICPSFATHNPIDDLAAVIAGAKPATFIDYNTDVSSSAVRELLALTNDENGRSRLARRSVTDGYGNAHVFYGTPENVEILAQQYDHRRGWGDGDFHRAVGKALGYPEEAVERYARAQARGPVLRWLGKLLKIGD